jgi:cysteine desulfurase/selenocysteine lyase
VSLAFYNTRQEIDALVSAQQKIVAAESAKAARPAQSASGAIAYPEPAAASVQEAAEEMIELFDFLGDWEQRHQQLVEMGDKLPPMPAELKTDVTRVRGCMSVVHLFGGKRPGAQDTLDFLADSDAAIVRGLIALLERVFAGQKASEILAFDVAAFLKRLGLDQHLSMGRRNGLDGMIQRIRALAAGLSK